MRKEFESHEIFFVHKHDGRFIVLYTTMAAVASCENDLTNLKMIFNNTPE